MSNLDREPILNWSVREVRPLPISWNYLYLSCVDKHIRTKGQFRLPYRTPQEALDTIPSELYGTAWLVRYTTSFGLPFVTPEDKYGAIVSNQEIYAEPVLNRLVEPPKLFGYEISSRQAKYLKGCKIARVENERIPFDWWLENGGITGEYAIDGGKQSLNYHIDPIEHNLSMSLYRREGERSSGINVTLRGDCSDKPFVEVSYGESMRDSSLMSFKFDRDGDLFQTQFRAKMEGSELHLEEDPRVADLFTIDHPLIVGKMYSCLADFIHKRLGISKAADRSFRLDTPATIRQVIDHFISGTQDPLREWLVFNEYNKTEFHKYSKILKDELNRLLEYLKGNQRLTLFSLVQSG